MAGESMVEGLSIEVPTESTMKPIHIFRHIACEGPGYLGEVLARNEIPHHVIHVDQGAPIPESPVEASALVFMGGPMSVNDPLPWIREELALIERAFTEGVPLLGHCLGGQLISRALGAAVTVNPVKEIGWFPVEHVSGPDSAPLLTDIPDGFKAFHWHGETFSLPEGAVPLLRSEHCENQAWAMDSALAFQCHIEMTERMVREWALEYAHELTPVTASVQSAEAMQECLGERVGELQAVADLFYSRWLAQFAF